jgi:aspartyl-tRNA(Asn)/glutamyl-tRNA(Gln) amidotransferase subunit C
VHPRADPEIAREAQAAALRAPVPARELAEILEHADDIAALDLAGVEPMARPLPLVNVFRADEPGAPLDRDEVLACAPVAENGQFRVPPVLGEAP